MAVPKKKRYKQIVLSRRSLEKIKLVKELGLNKAFYFGLAKLPVLWKKRYLVKKRTRKHKHCYVCCRNDRVIGSRACLFCYKVFLAAEYSYLFTDNRVWRTHERSYVRWRQERQRFFDDQGLGWKRDLDSTAEIRRREDIAEARERFQGYWNYYLHSDTSLI